MCYALTVSTPLEDLTAQGPGSQVGLTVKPAAEVGVVVQVPPHGRKHMDAADCKSA